MHADRDTRVLWMFCGCCSELVRFFISPLTSVNLLRNDIGDGAAAVIAAAEQNGKIKTLCGIKPDQTEANYRQWGLKPADAQLLAFDLKFSSPLTTLDLGRNNIGVEGAKALADVLPKW